MATSFLLRNNWFGKALCTTGAFAIAPLDPTSTAIWSAVGFGLGYQFDQFASHEHLSLKQSASAWRLLRETKHHNPWMIFTFAALGEMARIAGKNSSSHRSHALRLMQEMRFDPEAKERARRWYQAGGENGCPIAELAERCRRFGHYEFESFALHSFEVAATLSDNAKIREQCQLARRGLQALLGLEQPNPKKAEAETEETNVETEPPSNTPSSVADARRLLGIDTSANKAAIKTAYRRMASKHHPDRLPDDATASQRKRAQTTMADINVAKDILDTALS